MFHNSLNKKEIAEKYDIRKSFDFLYFIADNYLCILVQFKRVVNKKKKDEIAKSKRNYEGRVFIKPIPLYSRRVPPLSPSANRSHFCSFD